MTTIPDTMSAVVYQRQRRAHRRGASRPDVGAGDVLIEVSHCGVCGSDLHMILDGWGRKGSVEGHEWSGVVVAVGDGVTEWNVGDHIVGGPSPRCGECEPCRTGHPSLCMQRGTPGMGDGGHQGAYARYIRQRENEILRVPKVCRCATPRWPSHWRSRCTASRTPASSRASGRSCWVPDPSAR